MGFMLEAVNCGKVGNEWKIRVVVVCLFVGAQFGTPSSGGRNFLFFLVQEGQLSHMKCMPCFQVKRGGRRTETASASFQFPFQIVRQRGTWQSMFFTLHPEPLIGSVCRKQRKKYLFQGCLSFSRSSSSSSSFCPSSPHPLERWDVKGTRLCKFIMEAKQASFGEPALEDGS